MNGRAQVRRERTRELRFSFKEQREYETIDETIATLEAQAAAIDAQMEAAASDYVRLQELEQQKLEARHVWNRRWSVGFYLNELAERIAAQEAEKIKYRRRGAEAFPAFVL